jgi:hypothetical protein
MDNFAERLSAYMETLLEAGFDVQFVLKAGYEAALIAARDQEVIPVLDAMQRAADYVRKAARKLGIDRIAMHSRMTESKTPVREDHVDEVAKAVGQRMGDSIRRQYGC